MKIEINLSVGKQDKGYNKVNKPFWGRTYGSYIPQFRFNKGKITKNEIVEFYGWWLIWHWSLIIYCKTVKYSESVRRNVLTKGRE